MKVYKIKRKLDGLYWSNDKFDQEGKLYRQKCNAEYLIKKKSHLAGCTVEEFILVPAFNGVTGVRLKKEVVPVCKNCVFCEQEWCDSEVGEITQIKHINFLCSAQGYRNCVIAYNTPECKALYSECKELYEA